jgi:transposase InsO family protein
MMENTKDSTLKRNYIQKYQFLIKEYEKVKKREHLKFRFVKDFYAHHGTCAQTFLKYYGRYKNADGNENSLIPGKRGPRFKTRRTPFEIEQQVLEIRERGCNKYEINAILSSRLDKCTPSPSTIYAILKRYGKNRKTPKMNQEKRRIIKEKAGELGHVDCHHISKDTIANDNNRYYLICVIDSCSRVAWAEVMTDIKSISAMFGTLHCLNQIANRYDIRFAELLTDNGPEFGPKQSQQKHSHPFERLLIEMEIKHRYTRPYRPQTNGKVERFWRTLNEDLIEGTYFESIEHFKKELLDYLIYYNHLRPHQSLDGKNPAQFAENCQRIT